MALVHDWLTGMRGGEKCLEVFCELLPQAHLYTLFHFRGTVSSKIESLPIRTTFLQRMPFLRRAYRKYLPLFPIAIGSLDLSSYNLIVSLSHCVAKGAGSAAGRPHWCYCFTPMRYLWDQGPSYFHAGRYPRPALYLMERMLRRLRKWDASTHPTSYVAISRFVAERIRRAYGIQSEVIYPPVDLHRFQIGEKREDYYLIVAALAPYKRIDMAVEACSRLGRRLVIVGSGEDEGRLKRLAGPDVTFLGWRPDAEVAGLYSRCRAFLLPGEEDFGIAPLEAMASGRPVVALGRGGGTETIVSLRDPGSQAPTGILYDAPSQEPLIDALLELERREGEFDPAALRRHAARFCLERFRAEISEALKSFAASRRT